MSGPAENVYDVIMIGTGPVGYTVADRVRAAGLSVAPMERELVGRIRIVDVDPVQTVPGAGLYADGYAGRARIVVDEDHGYLLGVTFVGPGTEELIQSGRHRRRRPGPRRPALARRPLLPLRQRSLAPPDRGLPDLSRVLSIAPSRAAG